MQISTSVGVVQAIDHLLLVQVLQDSPTAASGQGASWRSNDKDRLHAPLSHYSPPKRDNRPPAPARNLLPTSRRGRPPHGDPRPPHRRQSARELEAERPELGMLAIGRRRAQFLHAAVVVPRYQLFEARHHLLR